MLPGSISVRKKCTLLFPPIGTRERAHFSDLHRRSAPAGRMAEGCRIETVAMEATGVYWIPLYEILEEGGFEVCLVNARHLKNVSGRKTDVLDCQWIQQLHTYGLLNPSFRPPSRLWPSASLVRHREMLVQYRSAHIQHMQKALTLMNVRLTNVLSDITGVTGLKIIRAILSGERNPQVLAASVSRAAKRARRRSPNRWKDITSASICLP